MRTEQELDQVLEDTLGEIRGASLGEAQEKAASARVWERLACEAAAEDGGPQGPSRVLEYDDYLGMIPDYLAGNLPDSQRLLLEDYSRESIPFRKALQSARAVADGTAAADTGGARRRGKALPAYLRVAAGLLLAVGLGFVAWQALNLVPMSWGRTAEIAELEGGLYQITSEGYLPLSPGQEIPFGETIRTAKDSGAVVRLVDGTEIEMSQRAELELVRRRAGTTIELSRGNIIVEAAKQRDGKLYVSTGDCLVSVTGTVFSVNRGTKGSRVSVIEGEVVVDYANREAVLTRGDQVSTHPSVGPVPVAREIAWSRNTEEHLLLLGELNELRKEIHQAMATQGLRYSADLLALTPENTTVYVAIPNLSDSLLEAHRLVRERIASSPVLRDWWELHAQQGHFEEEAFTEAIQKLALFGDFLGGEITVSLAIDPEAEEPQGLLLLAEAQDGAGLREFLEDELETLNAEGVPLRLIDDPSTAPSQNSGDEELLIWVGDGLLAASLGLEGLQSLQAIYEGGQSNPFIGSAFHGRLSQAYGDGVDWLVGADVRKILEQADNGEEGEVLDRAGLLDVEYLILERKQPEGGTAVHHRAVLSFDGERRGIASWLAPPAPMASLDFISPDANLVTAFLIKDPAELMEDLFAILEPSGEGFREELEAFEAENGISLMDDFAAPLGGEFAFALDGPLLPTPSWKAVVEVYDAPRLQNSIRWLVETANRHAQELGEFGDLTLSEDSAGGRLFYRLSSGVIPSEVHYTYLDGYLLAGPSRALVERAIQYRDSGYTLVTSPRFSSLLPPDGHANFSGLTYQNLKSVLGPLAEVWGNAQENLGEEQRQAVQEMISSAPATLACAYGESDRIVFVYNGEDGVFANLLGFGSAIGLEQWMEDAFQGGLEEALVAPAAQPTV